MNDHESSSPYPLLEPLTERELNILSLMAEGRTNREIGIALHLAETTVKWHNTQLFEKLAVTNRREAVARCAESGLLRGRGDRSEGTIHNLPRQTTLFVGRYQEMSDLAHLLSDPTIRLITILGAGGMGKTRLAIEFATDQLQAFPDGVFFVNLAPLIDPNNIPTTLAEAIGFRFGSGTSTPTEQLLDYLRRRQVLLVLDNFEHLLRGAALVGAILAQTNKVKMLVTSREQLNMPEETILRLGGLDTPINSQPKSVLEYSSARLFVQSATRIRPDFELAEGDVDHILQICELTAGLPLAVLLAAAWIDVLTVEEIASELTRGLDVLEGDLRNVPERHRGIRAVFEPSWQRLSLPEREGFMRFSVFRGGCSLDAASAVTGAELRTLAVLVSKSLLQRDLTSGRFEIHELLRQYGAEKLAMFPEDSQATQERHAAYYRQLLQALWPRLQGRNPDDAITTFTADLENIRQAWYFLIDQGRTIELSDGFYSLCHTSDQASRGLDGLVMIQHAAEALETAPPSRTRDLALGRALICAGDLLVIPGRFDDSLAAAERGLRLLQETGSPIDVCQGYESLARTRWFMEDFEGVRAAAEAGLFVAKESQDPRAIARQQYWLGVGHRFLGQFVDALRVAEEAMNTAEAMGKVWLSGLIASHVLGPAAAGLGDYDAARDWFERSLCYVQVIGQRFTSADIHRSLGGALLLRDDLVGAETQFLKALRLQRDGFLAWQAAIILVGIHNLPGLAAVLEARGDTELAATVYACVAQHAGVRQAEIERATECLAALRDKLAPAGHAAAAARGTGLDMEDLLDELLQLW